MCETYLVKVIADKIYLVYEDMQLVQEVRTHVYELVVDVCRVGDSRFKVSTRVLGKDIEGFVDARDTIDAIEKFMLDALQAFSVKVEVLQCISR